MFMHKKNRSLPDPNVVVFVNWQQFANYWRCYYGVSNLQRCHCCFSSSDDRTSGVVFLPYSEAMNVILMCLQQVKYRINRSGIYAEGTSHHQELCKRRIHENEQKFIVMIHHRHFFQEYEWEVLDVVLKIIPETLQDKNLILSGRQYLNSICTVLSKMVSVYL
jgi:hypothetical protein